MERHDVTLLTKRQSSDTGGSRGSSATTDFAELDHETHREAYLRLGWAAFSYAVVYFLAFSISWFLESLHSDVRLPARSFIIAGISITWALGVFTRCRLRNIPPSHLPIAAVAFAIIGAIGINAGYWGWESRVTDAMHAEGVPWVCVWILVFPTLMPASPRKILFASLTAASTGPIIVTLSGLANSLPPGMTWASAARFAAVVFFPAYIAAALAHWSALFYYKLSRAAADARRMGSYQLVERIGAGGMGEVWRAKHRLLARPAAIKLIRGDALGRDEATRTTARKRFEREAQATAALGSPHTIDLYDFGITDDGTFYYVMELLEGIDLKRLVERHGPLPGERVVHILRQACHSLHDAHVAGMVHRDIKPANIFACRRGQEYDFVKVLDFGLVAASAQSDGTRTQLTQEGFMSGTPAFMAPEMASGEGGIDPRVDIYALGCVGYWLLTGHLVFEGSSPMAVILKHVKDPPPPPSTRSELPVDRELERIILACLEKDPARRPASSLELARRLARCQESAGAWTEQHAQNWWRTHVPALAVRS
ncbi:MAG: serine/threonine-protein kinase [bacterium]